MSPSASAAGGAPQPPAVPAAPAASAGDGDAAMAAAGPSSAPNAPAPAPSPAQGRSAPVRSLPNKQHKFVVIEYPGVLSASTASLPSHQQLQQQPTASSSTPSSSTHTQAHARAAPLHHTLAISTTTDLSHSPSLARALQTLDPRPPALASAAGALAHLQQHVAMPDAVIECRIGSAGAASGSSSAAGSNGQASASSSADVASPELFRHPLQGHIVSTNDGVLRLRTRVWRRRRRVAATDAQGDSAMSTTTTNEDVQLADFAFKPAVSSPAAPAAQQTNSGEAAAQDAGMDIHEQTLQLLSALQRMDVAAMTNFRFLHESESWGSKDFMVTPPAFSITTVARKYGFRQNPASRLQQQPDGTSRYVNANRWRGLAPPNYSMKSTEPVPKAPLPHIEAEREKSDNTVLAALEKCFDDRPVWTRGSLFNTLPPAERKMVGLHKQYLPLFCYTTKDGPWRDCLIRYGFDPRIDRSSRFYQRFVFMNRKADELPKGRVKIGGDGRNLHRGVGSAVQVQSRDEEGSDENEEGGEDAEQDAPAQDEEEGETGGAEQDAEDGAAEEDAYPQSHVFDGVSLEANSGRFMLCDITDPIARPLIEADGPENVRETFDMDTGFYTKRAYERIKTVLSIRFHAVLQGREATQEECDKAAALIGGGDRAASAAGAATSAGEEGFEEPAPPSDEEEERLPAKRGRGGARGRARGATRGRGRGAASTTTRGAARGSRGRGSRAA